jgi:hypothetical protein
VTCYFKLAGEVHGLELSMDMTILDVKLRLLLKSESRLGVSAKLALPTKWCQ